MLKDTAELVAPEAIGPVSHAPVSEVDVWVIEPLFIQVTVSPTLIWIGFGVKQPDAGGQLTICADEFAAQAAVDARTSIANGIRQRPTSLRMAERTGGGYAWFRRLRIASCRRPLVASAFPPV